MAANASERVRMAVQLQLHGTKDVFRNVDGLHQILVPMAMQCAHVGACPCQSVPTNVEACTLVHG
jgi:hypothetical protein